MNYYSHHIGDYLTDTAHLSILEDGAYRRLMDRYYTTEQPLPGDDQALFRLLRARSEDEKEAVRAVLVEYFTAGPDGWSHKRCDAEIAAYREKSGKAAEAANKRWNKASNANAMPTHSERIPNAMLTKPNTNTNNQEPEQPAAEVASNTAKPAARCTAVELSIAARSAGVAAQPANPTLIVFAEQGIVAETVAAACEEAKRAKPGETIGFGYVAKIIERWARDAATVKVAGAEPPKKGAGAWWLSDATIAAKGYEMGMAALPGEQMLTFKGRIQMAIDNGGAAPLPPRSRVVASMPDDIPRGVKPAGLDLKSLVRKVEA